MSASSLLLLTTAVVSVFVRQSGAQISCYNCSSDNSNTDANGCGRLASNVQTTSAICTYCQVSVAGPSSFSRSCSTAAAGTLQNVCGPSQFGTTCTCNSTSNCNSQTLYYRGSLSCYVCQSYDYLDTGCGQNFNKSSPYVQTASNCMACGQTIVSSPDGGIYARSCINTLSSATTCGGSQNSCTFRCTTSLCNTANRQIVTGLHALLALGTTALLGLKRLL